MNSSHKNFHTKGAASQPSENPQERRGDNRKITGLANGPDGEGLPQATWRHIADHIWPQGQSLHTPDDYTPWKGLLSLEINFY